MITCAFIVCVLQLLVCLDNLFKPMPPAHRWGNLVAGALAVAGIIGLWPHVFGG